MVKYRAHRNSLNGEMYVICEEDTQSRPYPICKIVDMDENIIVTDDTAQEIADAMNREQADLKVLEDVYLELLMTPMSVRIHIDSVLAMCRNEIARAQGRDSEDIQNAFEETARRLMQ